MSRALELLESFQDLSKGGKNNWIKMNPQTLTRDPELQKELYDIIVKTYAPIGGHFDFQSPSDIPSDHDYWVAIDVDDDPEPDAVRIGKAKSFGIKFTASGTDGGEKAKAAMGKKTAELLNTPGYFGEMSGAASHVMIKYHNVPYVKKEAVEKILGPGKPIEWIGAHPDGKYPNHPGWYTRMLGGKKRMKIMLGKPKV